MDLDLSKNEKNLGQTTILAVSDKILGFPLCVAYSKIWMWSGFFL